MTISFFGFSDAENYRRRENKELFNKIFLRTDSLSQLDRPSTFFLVGEKGTGKTAYAVYRSNYPSDTQYSSHVFIRETDYSKFISLRESNNLSLSDYTDIWKVIILLIFAKNINEHAGAAQYFLKYPKFKALNSAIEEYYREAFSPEIITALQMVENSSSAVEVFAKHSGIGAQANAGSSVEISSDKKRFQTNLLFIQKRLQDAISSLSLPRDFTVFIDGIDIRPSKIPFDQYLDCVKGLANAAWSLNNDFFPSVRDSKGRLKCVLLLRPDIFNSLGLQNRNTKLKDNSVVLEWVTDYGRHRNSEIFLLADRMFNVQQENISPPGDSWDHYFPFDASSLTEEHRRPTSFVIFLRYSYHRPRDILTMLDILKENYSSSGDNKKVFFYSDLFSGKFKESYGEYLLGEIKDSLSFYYDESEYEIFLKFFEFLNGNNKFEYDFYLKAFSEFRNHIDELSQGTPDFMKTPEEFLQFLYDQNVLCFIEDTIDEKFIRWCFRER